ncbi:MAG: HAD family phosphatase [Spirochaetota bacterium]|nr:HAD family phosphatase [Spirochaetota bacterium]
MQKYKAILFDMDGVIIDSMNSHAENWQEVFKGCGIHISKEDIFKREGMSGISSIKEILIEKGKELPNNDEMMLMLEKKLNLFEDCNVEVFPFVREIIELLRKNEVLLALVTGSLMRSVNHVLPDDILEKFSVIVTIDSIKKGKPDPEPYLTAMEQLGCCYSDSLVIENAPLGILSAKRANIDCFALETSLSELYLQQADIIFEDHKSFYEYLSMNF